MFELFTTIVSILLIIRLLFICIFKLFYRTISFDKRVVLNKCLLIKRIPIEINLLSFVWLIVYYFEQIKSFILQILNGGVA